MHALDESRITPVCLEVMATVLAVSRHEGRLERIQVIVPCPIRAYEALPVVGRFQLARGKEIVRFGLDGRPFGLHEELHDYGATFKTPAGNFAGPWCSEILGQKPMTPAKSDYPLPSPGQGAKGRLGDPSLHRMWDLDPDAARITAIRERAAADFAVCAGELLTVAPFPRWCVSADGSRIELVKSSDEIRIEENYVAAERSDAAVEVAVLQGGVRGEMRVRGKVLEMDPAYQFDRDEVYMARGIGRYFAEKFRVPLVDLPSDLVRAWHDVMMGMRMPRLGDRDQAMEVIASGFRLMAAIEACPALFGRAGPYPDPWWSRIRDRIVQVDGLGPNVLPEARSTLERSPHG